MNIETKSVSIEQLITFIIEHIEAKEEGSEFPIQNITFLVQVQPNDLALEDKVILKQAFKLISNRLTNDDTISLIAYSGMNGVALKQTSPKQIKGILFAIENLKSSIKEFHSDGIALAYDYAKENFSEESINTVIMIRTSNNNNEEHTANQATVTTKKKNNAVLITAIALLPEIISVIKN